MIPLPVSPLTLPTLGDECVIVETVLIFDPKVSFIWCIHDVFT